MITLEQILSAHREAGRLGELQKISEEMGHLMTFTSQRANAMLKPGATVLDRHRKTVAGKNLVQLQANYLLVQRYIKELQGEVIYCK